MFFQPTTMWSRLLFAALLLSLSLTACIGPDNPLILNVETPSATDTVADTGAEAEAAAEGTLPLSDVEVAAVEVNEVVPEDASAANAVLAEEVNLAQTLIQATFLLNREVTNLAGEEIGEVEDLIVDTESGQLLYVILDRDNFLGIGSDDLALPPTALAWTTDLELVINVDDALLDTLPSVADRWPAAFNEGWDAEIADFWRTAMQLPARDAAVTPVRLEVLVGIHAGGLGTDLGLVTDFLVHWGEERVAYLAINSNPGFYTPDRVLLVPFTASELEIQSVDSGAAYAITLLAVDEAVLDNAPFMDRGLFLTVDLIDQTFAEALDAYWRQQAR